MLFEVSSESRPKSGFFNDKTEVCNLNYGVLQKPVNKKVSILFRIHNTNP
jgi:hypothetical protein